MCIIYAVIRFATHIVTLRWYINNEIYHPWFNKSTVLKSIDAYGKSDYKQIKDNIPETLSVYDGKKLYTKYCDYENQMQQIREGKSDVIFPGKPDFYVTTTGTTSKSKLIPIFLKKPGISYPRSYLLPLLRKEIIRHMCFGRVVYFAKRGDIKEINGVECSNGITRQIANALNSKLMTHLITRSSVSPFPVYMNPIPSYPVMDLHIIHALLDRNVSAIGGYFTRSILEQFDRIINNKEKFCKGLELGEYDTGFDIYKFDPDSSRAKELQEILKDSNQTEKLQGIIKKIWPKLSLITCGKSAAFNLYGPRLNFYTGNIPIYSSVCASTEMTFGINLGNLNDDSYHFDHRFGVIHMDESLWYENKYLRLVVTTKNGLVKYLINDLITINDDCTFTCEGRFTFYEETGITEREFAQIIIKHLGIFTHDALFIDAGSSLELYCEHYPENEYNRAYFDKVITNIANDMHFHMKKPVLIFKYVNKGTFKKILDQIELDHSEDFVSISREQIKLPRLLKQNSPLVPIIHENIY